MDTLNWMPAPRKTEWGNMMVVATVELDRDHTLDLHCEVSAVPLVKAALKRLVGMPVFAPQDPNRPNQTIAL